MTMTNLLAYFDLINAHIFYMKRKCLQEIKKYNPISILFETEMSPQNVINIQIHTLGETKMQK